MPTLLCQCGCKLEKTKTPSPLSPHPLPLSPPCHTLASCALQHSACGYAQLSPSPRWSPTQGCLHKDQAPGRVTSRITLGLSRCVSWSLRWPLLNRSQPSSLSIFHIKRCSRSLRHKLGGHTTDMVGVILQDYKPLVYNNGMRNH